MVQYGSAGRRPTFLPIALALAVLAACAGENPPLRLATTTSVRDSGLLDVLLPAFKQRTGIDVGVTAVGTGMALRLAERGEVDVVITHDRSREEAFVAAGHALGRAVFARSDFVLVGPPGDPAGIRGLEAAAAFRRLRETGGVFASRGDSSGTHARELLLWREVGAEPPRPSGYVEVRAGMLTTLQFASEKDAYTLTDRATFLAHRDRLRLAVLVAGDPLLENDYAVMVVDPARHPAADRERARLFAGWLRSEEARRIVRGLRRAGEPLFRVPEDAGASAAGPATSARPAAARELTVSAAISLKDALREIGPAFEATHPGSAVILNVAASGDLQRQIEAGAPADVFVSAAAPHVDALQARGAIDSGSRRDVACNRLVVVVPAGSAAAPPDLSALRSLERIAIGNPRTVPAGRYARQALEAAGLWERSRGALIFAENARQTLEYVARGEVDAAFVYRTDAHVLPERVRVAFEVDPGLHELIVYEAAVVAASPQRELAGRFVEFLTDPPGRAALERHGFGPPPCPAPEDRR